MSERGQRSTRVVDAVMHELKDRSGFDHWWDGIDPDVQNEIRATLRVRVEAILETQQRAVSVERIAAWLRSEEWAEDETWRYYADAVAKAIEQEFSGSTDHPGAV